MSWLTDREDAARHPRRVLGFTLVAGLVGGGAIGYFRFDHSVAWAVALGLTFAAILTYGEMKALQTPPGSRAEKRSLGIGAFARLLALFLVLLIALLVGIVTESLDAFIVVSAAGLALWLVLRFTIWR